MTLPTPSEARKLSPDELRRRAENMRRYALFDGVDHDTCIGCLLEASKMEARAQKQEDEENGKTH